jgi:hypothetical protein
MAEKQMLAFHFIFLKRYFPIYQGISEDLTPAASLASPEPVKKNNTKDSEIVVRQVNRQILKLACYPFRSTISRALNLHLTVQSPQAVHLSGCFTATRVPFSSLIISNAR